MRSKEVEEAMLNIDNEGILKNIKKKECPYRTIENLTKRLNATEIMQLQNKERELDLDITYKTKKLESINKTIEKIEEEIIVLNDQYQIILDDY